MQHTVCSRQGRLAHSRTSRTRFPSEANPRLVRRMLASLCQSWLKMQKGRKRDLVVPFPVLKQLRRQAVATAMM